jgi:hypothetical protein
MIQSEGKRSTIAEAASANHDQIKMARDTSFPVDVWSHALFSNCPHIYSS